MGFRELQLPVPCVQALRTCFLVFCMGILDIRRIPSPFMVCNKVGKRMTPALCAGRYAYLEKQLEAKDTNGEKENGSSHKREKKERHEKSRDREREKDRKSSKREHRDGSRDRERKRHHSSHEHSRTEKERKHRSPERRCAAAR